jgi:hypothetical protein
MVQNSAKRGLRGREYASSTRGFRVVSILAPTRRMVFKHERAERERESVCVFFFKHGLHFFTPCRFLNDLVVSYRRDLCSHQDMDVFCMPGAICCCCVWKGSQTKGGCARAWRWMGETFNRPPDRDLASSI